MDGSLYARNVRPVFWDMHAKVYLDTCCLNRPFDDQRQPRVRLEAEAVLLILDRLHHGREWRWVRGESLDVETTRCPDVDRRQRVQAVLDSLPTGEIVWITAVEERATELTGLGCGPFDALHLASAERAGADVFLTTDDRLQRLATRYASALRVAVHNPLTWLTARESQT